MIRQVSRITLSIIVFFTTFSSGLAQGDLEVRLIQKSINCEMRRLVVELQVRTSGAPLQLGTSSVLLNYDPYVLGFETYNPNLFDAAKSCGSENWAEQDWDGKSRAGSFNLTLHRLTENGNCHAINNNWKKVGQLFFNIKKEAINPDLSIPVAFSIFNQQAPNDGSQQLTNATPDIVAFEAGLCSGELEENCEPVFSDIFTSDLAQWQATSNTSVVDGGLRVKNKGNNPVKTLIGNKWTDYILEVDATIETGKAGIVFRYQNNDNYYMWQIADDGLLRPHRRINGNWEILDYVSVGTQAGIRYHIKIQLEGNQISTWINNILVDQRTDDYFSKGRVGFRQDSGEQALFDNVNICVPNINTCTSSNIAIGKVVSQSSVDQDGQPERAVDGRPNGNFADGSVSMTQEEDSPWWELDLGASHNISHIRINNRSDCCANNLKQFHVFISDEPFQSSNLDETLQQAGVKKLYMNGKPNPRASFLVNRTGRYIRIQLDNPGILSLAEVEVMGCPMNTGGLLATYYDNNDFSEPRLTRVDRQIDFNWGSSSPHTAIHKETFSVRWEGEVRPPVTGTYKFWTRSNDGDRLWVNGHLLIDDWASDSSGWQKAEIDLVAGQKVSIRMEYFEETNGARAQLAWSYPGQSRIIIPRAYLNPRAGGLLATYYNDSDLGERMFTRIDQQIDFDWQEEAAHSTLEADNFSIRWEGELEPLYSEDYTFTVLGDDGVRLWIDDQLIIDQWLDQSGETGGTISLNAGEHVSIRMEYYENTGTAKAQLLWESASQAKAIIPSFFLYPKSTSLAFGEVGLAKAKHQWLEVPLEGTYLNPVVIAGAPSNKGEEGVVVRVKDVTATSFKIKVQEWDCLNGNHTKEDIPYIVVEAGIHILPNGQRLIAGNISGVTHDEISYDYSKAFNQSPILLSQLASYNGGDPAITRTTTTANSFTVSLQESENDDWHAEETVAWIAVEPGLYQGNMKFEANKFEDISSTWEKINFGQTYEEPPLFIAATGTKNEADPISLRYDHTTLEVDGVQAYLQEETCGDAETIHADETIHYLTFAETGLLTSLPMDFLQQETVGTTANAARQGNAEEEKTASEVLEGSILASPNPVAVGKAFQLNIKTAVENELVIVEFYTANGTPIQSQHIQVSGREAWLRFETQDLNAGLYFVKVTALQWMKTAKVVLQK